MLLLKLFSDGFLQTDVSARGRLLDVLTQMETFVQMCMSRLGSSHFYKFFGSVIKKISPTPSVTTSVLDCQYHSIV